MNFFKQMRWVPLLLLFLFVIPFVRVTHAATSPSLGAANTFGILANSYTNTGPLYTTINGDVGYTSVTGTLPTITGTNYGSGAPYATAGSDQATALTALNSQGCTYPFVAGTIDLATTNVGSGVGIYPPGVYCTTPGSAATISTGGITITGSGTHIFRINGAFTTVAFSMVNLSGGASADDIFWTPTGATSLDVNNVGWSYFKGTVIDDAGISMGKNVNWIGRALAYNGNVTTAEDDNITPAIGTVRVYKQVINDDGGTAIPASFNLHVKQSGTDVAGSPQPGNSVHGTYYSLLPGTYSVSEDTFSGYTQTFSGNCDSSGNINIISGSDNTCTITNNDSPQQITATLHVIKHVINDNGGSASASSFMLHVKGSGGMGVNEVGGSPAAGAESPGTAYTLSAGSYAVSEDVFTGYTSSFSGDCDASGNITLASGSNEFCTITNNDIAPATATLHVIKHVINDNGGLASASSFILHVKGSGGMGVSDVSGSPTAGVESPGTAYTLSAGTYVVSENTFSGYTSSFSGDCDASGNITLASGGNKTCTITNNDITPGTATLHVIKHVINDNGGIAIASSFNLHVKGSGGMGVNEVGGSPAAGVESPGTPYTLSAGTYAVSEDAFIGYTSSFSGDCDASGNIALTSGDNKTCTITNNDVGSTTIVIPATLHVIKIVVNDEGGKAIVSDAVVHVMSSLGDVVGSPHAGASSPGTSYSLAPGLYNVSENFFAGYTMKIGGDCAVNGSITLVSGDDKTCTITNNDIAIITIPKTPPVVPPVTVPPGCDICARLTYDLYIINPDKSERHTGTAWVRVTDRGNKIKRYSFEDATLDPKNPLYDYNDSVIDVDFTDCKNTKFMFVSSDASWKHQVRIKVSIAGVTQSDTLVTDDSKAVVGTIKVINVATGVNVKLACSLEPAASMGLLGKILLQIQQHGEAWYIRPETGIRYYMKDGPTAYSMMRNFGLGITDKDLAAIPSAQTVDELKKSTSICLSNSAANKSKGKILLQVQQHGEAWYVDVTKCRRIYLKDGAAAYTLMRFLGLGITDTDLNLLSMEEQSGKG